MGLLDLIRDAFAPPYVSQVGPRSPWALDDQLTKLAYDELWPGGSHNLPVTRATAMTVPSVARVRNLLCGTASRLPIIGMIGAEVMDPAPRLLRQPETHRPRVATVADLVDEMLFHGGALAVVTERYSTGRVMALRHVPRWAWRVEADGLLLIDGRQWPAADVKWFPAPHEGILSFGAGAIRRALTVELAAARGEDNPVPSIELHQTGGDPMAEADVDRLIRRWSDARRGKNGGVAYTNPSIETKVHGAPAEQLLIAGRNAAALNIARVCGVPAWVVDANVDGSSLNYSNTPSRNRELIDYALAPYLEAIAARLSMDDILPAGHWCRFDLDPLLSESFSARMAAYKVALDAGMYTVEELRARERGTPLEGSPPAPATGQLTAAADLEDTADAG